MRPPALLPTCVLRPVDDAPHSPLTHAMPLGKDALSFVPAMLLAKGRIGLSDACIAASYLGLLSNAPLVLFASPSRNGNCQAALVVRLCVTLRLTHAKIGVKSPI